MHGRSLSTIHSDTNFHLCNWTSGGGRSKFLRGTRTKKMGLRGVSPSKTHRFWPIGFLPMDNFATFLDFSFLFFSFLYCFSSFSEFLKGDVPTENVRGGGGTSSTDVPLHRFRRLCIGLFIFKSLCKML